MKINLLYYTINYHFLIENKQMIFEITKIVYT